MTDHAVQVPFGRPEHVHQFSLPTVLLVASITGSLWPPPAVSLCPPSDTKEARSVRLAAMKRHFRLHHQRERQSSRHLACDGCAWSMNLQVGRHRMTPDPFWDTTGSLVTTKSPRAKAPTTTTASTTSEDLESPHMVPFGEVSFRHIVEQYVNHYHVERPHQGLDHRIIAPDETALRAEGHIRCRDRLGGLLKYYYR